ncbi:cell envelope integrity protein CreD [Altererythrobacter sp. MF3-039]|uniref:cell envelope integrity protein CreD n=1 Tax=Altererythrobacter sp. MF3-039 TaxID=3252901 RepID=UPI00390C9311
MAVERTPGIKLLFVALIGAALVIPLLMVYGLVSDRQHQSRIAQQSITAGWGGEQVISGPVLVIPYIEERIQNEVVDGKTTTRTIRAREQLYLSPEQQKVATTIDPDLKQRSIYSAVIYTAQLSGEARFSLTDDLSRLGIEREDLRLDEVELRFGSSDPRGLQSDAEVTLNGEALVLKPGNGVAASGGSGFHAPLEWNGSDPLLIDWSYSLRGSHGLSLVPRGGNTDWQVRSTWPHPSFVGSFLPDEEGKEISADGFVANWSVSNLALGQAMAMTSDPGPPMITDGAVEYAQAAVIERAGASGGPSMAATIRLVEPVDLYSRVDRAVKYGFLFIGFTFLAFFMFDVVGGARVAAAEYLLTGAGLTLFFVLLLAFAEVIGFALAYVVASAAIIGLLTAYSAAVLGSWMRARVIGALLVGLYALLYVLLNLEAWSLLIGSVLLFVALAGVMYATRKIDWSSVGRKAEEAET